MVSWCSWLSRQSNTLKVSSSNLDEIIFFYFLFTSQPLLSFCTYLPTYLVAICSISLSLLD
ncbi:hypothetical protein F5Y06DRAFT_257037, partial [Hypoxylon sp. FL0890]